jgi:hypothetical protein
MLATDNIENCNLYNAKPSKNNKPIKIIDEYFLLSLLNALSLNCIFLVLKFL